MYDYVTLRYVTLTEKETQYVVSVRAFNQVGKGPVVYDLVYTTDAPSGNLTLVLQCMAAILWGS